jgi:hypothetical protein
MPKPVKLELLITRHEIVGFGVDCDRMVYVLTDCSRKRIPLYEFKCTKNLTKLLKEHFNW